MKLFWNGRKIAFPPQGSPNVKVPKPCSCGVDTVHGIDMVDDDRSYTSTAVCDGCGASGAPDAPGRLLTKSELAALAERVGVAINISREGT